MLHHVYHKNIIINIMNISTKIDKIDKMATDTCLQLATLPGE